MVKFLCVFYDETIHMSGSSYSTSNLFFETLQNVFHCLMDYCESDDYSLSNIARKMKVKYDKYWGDFEAINSLLWVVAVLDPYYKISVLEFWLQSNVGIPKAKKLLTTLRVSWTSYINIMLRMLKEEGAMVLGFQFQMKI